MNNFALICLTLVIVAVVKTAAYPPFDDNFLTEEDDDAEMIDLSHFGSSIFRQPSNETGLLVASYDPNTDLRNPEEIGEYLEGDILIPPSFGRNGLVAMSSHWPGAIVPFEISGYFGEYLWLKIAAFWPAFNESVNAIQQFQTPDPWAWLRLQSMSTTVVRASDSVHEPTKETMFHSQATKRAAGPVLAVLVVDK